MLFLGAAADAQSTIVYKSRRLMGPGQAKPTYTERNGSYVYDASGREGGTHKVHPAAAGVTGALSVPPGAASVAAVTANTAWLDDHGTSDEIHVLVLGSSSHRERMPQPGHVASLHV